MTQRLLIAMKALIDKITALMSWPQDKLQHFIVGVLVYAAAHFLGIWVGLIAVVVAAVGKEIFDWFHKENHTPDPWDAIVTIAGGVVGFVCGL